MRKTTALVLTLLAAAACAAPAQAAGPNASALRKLGLRITWPVAGTKVALAPKAKLAVRVRPAKARRHEVAIIGLMRVGATGLRLRQRLRSGTFHAQLPLRSGGNRYALTLRAGSYRYRTLISVPEPGSTPVDDLVAAQKAPELRPLPVTAVCSPQGKPAVEIQPPRATAYPGETIAMTLENAGTTSVMYGYRFALERSVDGVWTPLVDDQIIPLIAFELGCRATRKHSVTLPADLDPGQYRVSIPFTPATSVSILVDVIPRA